MNVRNIRWGYDGGGIGCGPVEGNTLVEVCVTGNDLNNYFILVTRMSEFERTFVSPMPLFDLLMHSNHFDVNSGSEFDKVLKAAIEDYEYIITEAPEEMEKSAFAKAIHLARLEMEEYYGSGSAVAEHSESDDKYIEEHYDGDLEDIELPELEASKLYDDEDDEEEED